MSLIFLRHTRPNIAEGICYGRTDLDVAESFESEAELVLKQLPSFERILTSPLKRCRKLADFIGENRGVQATIDDRLVEMDFGTWEGVPWSDVPREELDQWANDFMMARPHGGEAVATLKQRTDEVIRDVGSTQRSTLLVTHAGVIRAAFANGVGASHYRTEINFGGIKRLPEHTGMLK